MSQEQKDQLDGVLGDEQNTGEGENTTTENTGAENQGQDSQEQNQDGANSQDGPDGNQPSTDEDESDPSNITQNDSQSSTNDSQPNVVGDQSGDPLNQVSDQLSTGEKSSNSQKSAEDDIMDLHNTDIEYNEKGEHKMQPLEVMGYLARFDDFSIVRGYEKTKYQLEFDKLVREDRVKDIETTVKLLNKQGHEVSA
jgi:hypothetical protein